MVVVKTCEKERAQLRKLDKIGIRGKRQRGCGEREREREETHRLGPTEQRLAGARVVKHRAGGQGQHCTYRRCVVRLGA